MVVCDKVVYFIVDNILDIFIVGKCLVYVCGIDVYLNIWLVFGEDIMLKIRWNIYCEGIVFGV